MHKIFNVIKKSPT